jgi:hypothetical protein
VKSLQEFIKLIGKLDVDYFENTFHKSKKKYLEDLSLLFEQIENDFHYVYILKQKTHVFQLQWKESVLKAHLDLLIPNLPSSYLKQSLTTQLQAI